VRADFLGPGAPALSFPSRFQLPAVRSSAAGPSPGEASSAPGSAQSAVAL
jgi:hypothetical protein